MDYACSCVFPFYYFIINLNVDFETPPKMVMLGTGASSMTVNLTDFVYSSDPLLCPIKQIEIGKVLNKASAVVTPIPTWIKWDNITKLMTFSDFGLQEPGATFTTFVNVTTFYTFLQPTQYVGKVSFTPDVCSAMTFVKNYSHEAYIFTNTWETETGDQVTNKKQGVPAITVDITTKPPISTANETLC